MRPARCGSDQLCGETTLLLRARFGVLVLRKRPITVRELGEALRADTEFLGAVAELGRRTRWMSTRIEEQFIPLGVELRVNIHAFLGVAP
jgi:hypothetical protein